MKHFSWAISEILTITLNTTSDAVSGLFTTRFSHLYNGEAKSDFNITINLEERSTLPLSTKSVIREITIPEYCVFDDYNFYIIRGGKRARIPFESIGKTQEITMEFESGFPSDWIRRILDDIIAFHVVGFGISFVHAACLIHANDFEIIIPAWRGTGKTHLALSLLFHAGYAYKAEDQFFLDSSGNTYVYTDACHVDPKHMASFPEIREQYKSISYSLRTGIAKLLMPLLPPVNAALEFARRVVLKLFHPKVFVKIGEFVPDFRISHTQARQGVVVQLISQPDTLESSIIECGVHEVANSLLGGMQYERMDLYPFYFGWIYATGQRNEIIDSIHLRELDIIKKGLAGKRCYRLGVPKGHDWQLDELLSQITAPR